jgi:hypothetical protein
MKIGGGSTTPMPLCPRGCGLAPKMPKKKKKKKKRKKKWVKIGFGL